MPIAQAQATMKSVAELTASVGGARGKRVCLLLSGMLERSMLDHIDLQVRADILKNENVQLTADIAKLREKNVELNELNAYLQRQIYGKKAEPLPKPNATPDDPADPAVAVDEAKAAAARELQKKARAMLKAAHANGQPKEKGSGTEALLTQETVRRRVPEGLTCLCCSGPVKDLGLAHTATEIDCIPATYIKRTYLLHRGGCDCGGVSFIMPGPERGLEKTTASPRMIADCAVDKFLWHMPVHRQEAYLKLHGVDLSRSIMNGWILRGAMVCAPLWRALCKANRAQPVKQCDETPVCVVKGEESKDRFLWCVLSTLAITFDITETRNQQIAAAVLGEVGEATMTDGHGCYSKKSIPGVHSNCLAHARRKFYDALLSFPKEAFTVLTVIHDIFMVDTLANELGLDAPGRLELRKRKSMVLLIELRTLLESMNPPPKSSLGKAIKYALKRWSKLTAFMTDGRIPLSNNAVESRFRDVKLGFKNFLFAQSEIGAEAVAIYYSLIATARLYNLDPTAYLADVMTKITAGFPAKRIDELLPWNWQSTAAPPSTPPLISRDEDLPVTQVIELRRLAGKVRLTVSVDQPQAACQSG